MTIIGPATTIWSADGNYGITADGAPGWSADGREGTIISAGRLNPDGQTLTSWKNVQAIAGVGGDIWGANGGGATPIGGGSAGQTGWDPSIKTLLSDAEVSANYETALPGTVLGTTPASIESQMSTGALPAQTKDSSIQAGNSNSG